MFDHKRWWFGCTLRSSITVDTMMRPRIGDISPLGDGGFRLHGYWPSTIMILSRKEDGPGKKSQGPMISSKKDVYSDVFCIHVKSFFHTITYSMQKKMRNNADWSQRDPRCHKSLCCSGTVSSTSARRIRVRGRATGPFWVGGRSLCSPGCGVNAW